jgi:Spy/CpxP family protein refolding chaperone
MNPSLQWKLIAGFILVFVAGGMTGAFFGAVHAHHVFFENHGGQLSQRMRERLRVELDLTPDQVAKVTPIFDKTAAKLDDIREESGRKVHDTFVDAHRQIGALLTEEQKAKMQKFEDERHQRARRMRGLGGPGGRPPPPPPPP